MQFTIDANLLYMHLGKSTEKFMKGAIICLFQFCIMFMTKVLFPAFSAAFFKPVDILVWRLMKKPQAGKALQGVDVCSVSRRSLYKP